MDIEGLKKTLESLVNFFNKPVFLYPFLVIFGFLSRTCYDYFQNKVVPERRKLLALFVLSCFSVVMIILLMRAFNVSEDKVRASVPIVAFMGHNILTYIMENKDDVLNAVKNRIKKMIK